MTRTRYRPSGLRVTVHPARHGFGSASSLSKSLRRSDNELAGSSAQLSSSLGYERLTMKFSGCQPNAFNRASLILQREALCGAPKQRFVDLRCGTIGCYPNTHTRLLGEDNAWRGSALTPICALLFNLLSLRRSPSIASSLVNVIYSARRAPQ